MSKLLRANLARLWKNRVFWIDFFLLAVWGAVQRIGIRMDTEARYLDEAFWIAALFIGIALSVFISLFIGVEFEEGTIRNKIIMGHTRAEIYFANVTVCIIAGWLMCLGCLISSLLAGIPLLGFFHTELSTVFLQGICVFALSAAYAAIYCFAAMTVQSRALAAIACILLSFLLLFAGAGISNQLDQEEALIPDHELGPYETEDEQNVEWVANPSYISGTERRIYETIFDVLPGGQSLQLSGMADEGGRYIVMLLASLGWVVISSSCGAVIFRKRDLK